MANSKITLAQLEKLREVQYGLCGHFSYFVRRALKILEPGKEILWNWHHDCVAEYLEAVHRGEIKRLIINEPPRYLKSIEVSVCFPAWVWGPAKDPEHRFLCASYAQSLATKHSVDCRTLIESPWYAKAWQNRFKLAWDQNQKMEFSNDKRGHRIATSMLGTATGKGGKTLIIDDPHDTTGAASQVEREKDIETFRQKFTTRLDDKKDGAIIVVMQRLHQRDLSGVLLEEGGWTHLNLQGIAEKKTIITFPQRIQDKSDNPPRQITREVGDILHPAREGPEEIEKQRRSLGSYGFSAQYQQNPTPAEGGMIKRKWVKFYTQLPGHIDEFIQSWDMTFKDGPNSDFVVGRVWARSGSNCYLTLDGIRARMDFPTTLSAFRTITEKNTKALRKIVEAKANGQALIDMLTKQIPGVVAFDPKVSKEARLSTVSPMWESGNVYLPDPTIAPWIHDFIEEIVAFPNGAFDDEVDSMSQALLYFLEKINSGYMGLRVIVR